MTEHRDLPAATAPVIRSRGFMRSLLSRKPMMMMAAVDQMAAFMAVVLKPISMTNSTPTGTNSLMPRARDFFRSGTSSEGSPCKLCFTDSRSTILNRHT